MEVNNKLELIISEISKLNLSETKPISEKIVKFNEEFGEFSAEVIKMIGFTHKPYDEEHLIEEMADTLQVLLSIYLSIGKEKNFDINRVFDAISEKNKKWEEKISQYTSNKER